MEQRIKAKDDVSVEVKAVHSHLRRKNEAVAASAVSSEREGRQGQRMSIDMNMLLTPK